MPEGMKTPERCRRCRYRSSSMNSNICDYFYLTGKLRGCPIDENCKRFEEGPRATEKPTSPPPEPLSEGEKETQRYITEQKLKASGKDGIYLPRRY